ncbi:MAG: protein-L-isoaspartate O-methyltransferase family protein [Rhizobiaceae bacterium]
MNFEQARENMVDCQVRPCDVTDHELIAALLAVPREEFVDEKNRELAYLDRNIRISEKGGQSRFMMSASPLSKLLQLCDPQSDNVVLVVGAGIGYSCALFSILASSIVGIEEDERLAGLASENLSRLGYDNAAVLSAKLTDGWEREAPYDIIFMEGAVEEVPEMLVDQLAEGGRLVAVVGSGNAAKATLFHKKQGLVGKREVFNLAVPLLPGFETTKEFSL